MDQDDRAIVWSESDMTAAFHCCLLEPSWYSFAIDKPVPGSLSAAFDPSLANEPVVYPALRVMPMGWQSACGLLQYFHRLCFLPPPLGAGLDPSKEIGRDIPSPRTMDKSRQDFFTVNLDGFSQTELVHISELASAAEIPKATAAVHAAWANWGIPWQLGKEVIKQDEIFVLGARVSGSLGRISLPRTIVSQLTALSSWFCQDEPRTNVQGQIVGGRWVRSFQFRRELSSIFTSFWDWIHPEGLRAHCRLLPESMINDVLLASLSLPVCVSVLRAKVSPLEVATDASEWELGGFTYIFVNGAGASCVA